MPLFSPTYVTILVNKALYTTLGAYAWLVQLKLASTHSLHETIFTGSACHLLLCFCVNALALRITITNYIMDLIVAVISSLILVVY